MLTMRLNEYYLQWTACYEGTVLILQKLGRISTYLVMSLLKGHHHLAKLA